MLGHRLEVVEHGFAVVDLHLGQFGVSRDRGQNVVEVVRNASREGADRLHFLGVAELFLQAVGVGDVAGVDHDQRAAVATHGRAPVRLDDAPGTVLVPKPVLDRGGPLGADEGALQPLLNRLQIVGMDEVADLTSHDFLGGEAQVTQARGAMVADDAGGIDHDDQVGGVFDQQAEPGLPLAQFFIGQAQLFIGIAPLLQQLALGECVAHGGAQPGKSILQQIVGRAFAHRLDGGVFADRAGDENKGCFRVSTAEQFEGKQAGKLGQVVIGEHDVGSGAKGIEELGLGLDPNAGEFHAVRAERSEHQLRVQRVVFHQDHRQGNGAHDGVEWLRRLGLASARGPATKQWHQESSGRGNMERRSEENELRGEQAGS
jgi:hypothetical protein